MHAKNITLSAKREVQTERNAERDVQIFRSWRTTIESRLLCAFKFSSEAICAQSMGWECAHLFYFIYYWFNHIFHQLTAYCFLSFLFIFSCKKYIIICIGSALYSFVIYLHFLFVCLKHNSDYLSPITSSFSLEFLHVFIYSSGLHEFHINLFSFFYISSLSH